MLGLALIAQLAIVAHAPDTVGACEPLDVSVAVSAPGTILPRVVVPSFQPFDLMRSATMPSVARDSRAVPSVMVEYRYVLVTDRAGTYTIPAFEARLGATVARSQAMRVVVMPSTGDAVPAVLTRARIDTDGEADLRAAGPDTVYVGQQANYDVAVFLNSAMRRRLRRNPTFYPPDMQSVLAYDLAAGGTERAPGGASRCFDALVYRRAIFPLQAGRIVIPPAQLTYSLPVGASFFSREESHELQTDSAVLIAVDPPAAGRPADFDGAVGDLQVSARLEPAARVGDPLTLTVRVSGSGNVKLYPRPRLDIPWASAVPSDVRVRVDTTGRRIGGSKDFDWVVTPRVAGNQVLPAVRYAYFDPAARRYQVAMSSSLRVAVRPGTLAAVDSTRRQEVLPLRTEYRGAIGEPLSSHPAFWLLLAMAPLPAVGARWRSRRRRAPRPLKPAARMDHAVRAAGPHPDGRALRRAFVSVLGERLALDSDAFTRPDALRHALRLAGVSTDAAAQAEQLLRELDAAAFSGQTPLVPGAGESAVALVRRIDQEALDRRELPFRAMALVLVAAVGLAASVHALQSGTPADTFRAGVAAYQRRDFVAARDAFARVVAAEPRAADGWANLGTAAWAGRDTVHAVVGWRRALGLEPLAGDVRGRLGLVHGIRALSPGYAPPVPLDAAILLMALGWLAACVAWHPAVRRRAPWTAGWAVPLAVGAALVGLGAVSLQARLSARGVAVARTSVTLSDDPALGADRGPTVVVGEMVRVLGRQGAWSRVQLDGGREGWMANEQLVALDAPLPSLD